MATLTCTCDLCFTRRARYVQADHQGVRLKVDGTTGVLDLCEEHYEQLLTPVLEAIADRKADDEVTHRQRHRRYGPIKCEVPGCDAAPLKHTGTFWQHLRGVHDMTMEEYREAHGDPEPTPVEELPDVEARCKVKGCGKVYSTALGHRWPRNALISHLRGRHGLQADGRTPVQ